VSTPKIHYRVNKKHPTSPYFYTLEASPNYNNIFLSEEFCYCIQDVVRKPEGKRPLGLRRRSWKDNIKIDLKEIGREGVD